MQWAPDRTASLCKKAIRRAEVKAGSITGVNVERMDE